MKRVIAISDSHGDVRGLMMALEQAAARGRIDYAFFLGDGAGDFEAASALLRAGGTVCMAVRGNNDWSSRNPVEQTVMVGSVRFYLSHGHAWHVKYGLDRLWYAARECEAQVALYGHTHREGIELERGMYLINPGAVCERSARRSAYAEILVEENGFLRPSLCRWDV